VKVNERPVYSMGKRNIVHLSDGTWAIKDGGDDNVDADVYAYVKDSAWEPHRVGLPWSVAADNDGFVLDTRGQITPGRSATVEAIEAASLQAAKLARESASSGMKAEIGIMDRSDREELQQFRAAAHNQRSDPKPERTLKGNSPRPVEKQPESRPESPQLAVEDKEPPPFVEKEGVARLKITIVGASGLKKADALGGSDPYVICEVPGKGSLGRTRVLNNTQKPVWNHELDTKYSPGDKLKFTVWDEDSMSKSDLLGHTVLNPDRFYPGGFRGQLALKDGSNATKATLEIMIDVVQQPKGPSVAPTDASLTTDVAEKTTTRVTFHQEPRDKAQPAVSTEPSPDLIALQQKLEAASAREAVLKGKLESEQAAREVAEENAARKAAASWQKKTHDHYHDHDDYDHEDYDDEGWHEDHHDEEEEDHEADDEIEQYRKAFLKFDTDHNGTISLEELAVVMEGLERPQTEAELRVMMKGVDDEGDGVDFHEFLELIDALNEAEDRGGPLRPKYRVMFEKFDLDGSGWISSDELRDIIEASGKKVKELELEEMLSEFDRSGDGHIEFEEFCAFIERLEGKGSLKAPGGPITAMNLVAIATSVPTLAPSDRKRLKAYLKRRGFAENANLEKACNQQKRHGGFMKKGFEYPLHGAAADNLPDIVWLLLESGADRNLKNSDGRTAYEATLKADAKSKGGYKEVLELLVDSASQTEFDDLPE